MFKVVDKFGFVTTVYSVSDNGGGELWFLVHQGGEWDWINAHTVRPYEEGN